MRPLRLAADGSLGGMGAEDDPAAGPLARRYLLPPGHVPVLADTGDVRYQAFNGAELVRAARWMPEVAEAIRSGGAPPPLPWAPEGRPEFNRAVFLNLLAKQWLPAIADVDLRLRSGPPARVADLACGTGWSSIAMAQAYPLISVDGFDLDADAIQAARRNAEEADWRPCHVHRRRRVRPRCVWRVRPGDDHRRAARYVPPGGCAARGTRDAQGNRAASSSPPPLRSRSNITTPGAWSHACLRSWATRIPPRPEP